MKNVICIYHKDCSDGFGAAWVVNNAMLTWQWFHPFNTAPKAIRSIQDRDLWKFELPRTREVMAAVFSYPQTIEVWNRLMRDGNQDDLHREGFAILRAHDKNIREAVEGSKRRLKVGGVDVPVANVPYYMASDAGHMMGEGEPFAATYYDAEDGRHFSLRSRPGGYDVSRIAKMYGGGGHRHAAGFTLKRKGREWKHAALMPRVEEGTEKEFWIATRAGRTGKTHVSLAFFQNRMVRLGDEKARALISPVRWVERKGYSEFPDTYQAIEFSDQRMLVGWAEYAPPEFTG